MRDFLYCEENQLSEILLTFKTSKIHEIKENKIKKYMIEIADSEFDENKYLKCLIKRDILFLSMSVLLNLKKHKHYPNYLSDLIEEVADEQDQKDNE